CDQVRVVFGDVLGQLVDDVGRRRGVDRQWSEPFADKMFPVVHFNHTLVVSMSNHEPKSRARPSTSSGRAITTSRYSLRITVRGSSRAARRAGTHAARPPVPSRSNA